MSKCRICRAEYVKRSMQHVACSPICANEWVRRQNIKKQKANASMIRKEVREQRAKLKTRQQWLKEAQEAVNAYIRERDSDLPCISCGRHHNGANHAGHYRSVGAASHLRFDERNIHKQCAPCNLYKSGNAIDYRIGLIQRIGKAAVEELENDSTIRRWTILDAQEIKTEYKQKLKELLKHRSLAHAA